MVIVLSILFSLRYNAPDTELEKEKIMFSEMLVNNFSGKFIETGYNAIYLPNANLQVSSEPLKSLKLSLITGDPEFKNMPIGAYNTELSANSLSELIQLSKTYEIDYIVIGKENVVHYPFLKGVYDNESKYPYLVKIFDSKNSGYHKFMVKVFKIDFDKFDKEISGN